MNKIIKDLYRRASNQYQVDYIGTMRVAGDNYLIKEFDFPTIREYLEKEQRKDELRPK
jgi:hypothetical protein